MAFLNVDALRRLEKREVEHLIWYGCKKRSNQSLKRYLAKRGRVLGRIVEGQALRPAYLKQIEGKKPESA